VGLSDRLKHRLNPKTIAKEVFAGFTDKILPQGADELGNWLYTGSPYLPWPGKGQLPPVPMPEAGAPEKAGHGVHGPPDGGLDGTMLPPEPAPPAPPGPARPRLEGPIIEGEWHDVTPRQLGYTERLNQITSRGGQDQDRDRDRDRGRGMSR